MRRHGPDGIGVATLMKRAGLTHGGFYAHFENRDELVAFAVDRMFADSATMLDRCLSAPDTKTGLAELIDNYLSVDMRDALEQGCPLAGLSGDAVRMPAAARRRFADGIMKFQGRIARTLESLGHPEAEALASSALSEMVGAMSLARALEDEDTAAALLHASREQLKRRLGIQLAA